MKTRTWVLLLGALLVVCLGASVLLMQPGERASWVEVLSEGKVLYTLSLATDQELTVTTDRGSNTITIRDGAVAVTAADCPDHYCMCRGFCSGGAEIVCLPHQLVIRFLGEQEIDGVAG